MFDYEKLEYVLLQQMKGILDEWTRKNEDIYIFSLDCAREMKSIGVIANTVHYLVEQTEPDAEERIEIFEKINRKSVTQEYTQHIEGFA